MLTELPHLLVIPIKQESANLSQCTYMALAKVKYYTTYYVDQGFEFLLKNGLHSRVASQNVSTLASGWLTSSPPVNQNAEYKIHDSYRGVGLLSNFHFVREEILRRRQNMCVCVCVCHISCKHQLFVINEYVYWFTL